MIQEDFDAAVAIKKELAQIATLQGASGGLAAPFARAQSFHNDFEEMITLSQSLLDTANAGWAAALTARKATLEASFDALGE